MEDLQGLSDDQIALAETLKSLVAIPSPSGHERAVQEYITSWLREHGVEACLEDADNGLTNVFAQVSGAPDGPGIWIGGHCDTVTPSVGWSFDPHTPFIRDGKVFGVGAMDMKSGIATAMHTLVEMAQRKNEWQGRILFGAFADEEAFSRGAQAFMRRGHKIDFAIMCEPHFKRPATAGVGKLNVRIAVQGVSAHGSLPHEGVNAAVEAARFVAALETLPLTTDPAFGRSSRCVLSINTKEGPYEIRVPDRCEVLVNWHFLPGETADGIIQSLRECAAAIDSRAEFSFETVPPFYPCFVNPPGSGFIDLFMQSIAEDRGCAVDTDFCFGVSDANLFSSALGVPTVLFGPSGANLHAADEWADIGEMVSAKRVYTQFLNKALASA